jgi:hypothetical protein
MANYRIGQTVQVRCEFRNDSGVLADPTTVTLAWTLPAGTTNTYTYAAGQITKESTGVYYKNLSPTTSGVHYYRFTSTGDPATSEEGDFYVKATSIV